MQVNYKEALTNRAKLEFLEHRSTMNQRVMDLTLEMAQINTQLIAVNSKVMDTNAVIVEFNSAQIAANTALLRDGLNAASANPEVWMMDVYSYIYTYISMHTLWFYIIN